MALPAEAAGVPSALRTAERSPAGAWARVSPEPGPACPPGRSGWCAANDADAASGETPTSAITASTVATASTRHVARKRETPGKPRIAIPVIYRTDAAVRHRNSPGSRPVWPGQAGETSATLADLPDRGWRPQWVGADRDLCRAGYAA